MNKGIVMDVSKRSAVVMTRDGRFVKLKAHPGYQIGEEITIENMSKAGSMRWIASAAAAILMCIIALSALTGHMPFGQKATAVAYVSIDINPSVELGLDSNSKVVEASGLNEDGQSLLQDMDLIGRDVEEVAEELIIRAEPYLEQYISLGQGEIVITSASISQDFALNQEQLKEKVKTVVNQTVMKKLAERQDGSSSGRTPSGDNPVAGEQDGSQSADNGSSDEETASNGNSKGNVQQTQIKVAAITVSNAVREDAKQKGISAGKLAVGLIIAQKSGHALSLDDVGEKSISQLAEEIGGLDELLNQDQEQLISDIEKLFEQSNKGKSDIGIADYSSVQGKAKNNDKDQNHNGKGNAWGRGDNGNNGNGNNGNGNGNNANSNSNNGKSNGNNGNSNNGNGMSGRNDDGNNDRLNNGRGDNNNGEREDDNDVRPGNGRGNNGNGNDGRGDEDDDRSNNGRGNKGNGNDGRGDEDDDRPGNGRGNNGNGNDGRGDEDDDRPNNGRGNKGNGNDGRGDEDNDRPNNGRGNKGNGNDGREDDDNRPNNGRGNKGNSNGGNKGNDNKVRADAASWGNDVLKRFIDHVL